jgi:hypothetical protein
MRDLLALVVVALLIAGLVMLIMHGVHALHGTPTTTLPHGKPYGPRGTWCFDRQIDNWVRCHA